MIRALIFDLDNCLAPSTEVGVELYEPALEAIRRTNRGQVDAATLERAFADIWRAPLDWVAQRYGFSEEMRDAAWQEFVTMEVQRPMNAYGDIEVLGTLGVECFLVTSGFRRLQQSKIKALRLEPFFKETLIDAIDEPNRLGKKGLFELILQQNQLRQSEVLVIGDNPDSELAAGKELGILTVQSLRPGVLRADMADYHIESLSELPPIMRLA